MLFLDGATIKEIYTMNNCIEDVEKAFKYGFTGKTVSPIRVSVPHEKLGAETLYMPSYIEPENYTAVKIVSIFPNNAQEGRNVLQGIILLTDAMTGEHVAVMDASYLTVLRTGASSGVATKYLSKKDAKVCAVLGCGAQALGQVQAVMATRELHKIILWNRTPGRAEILKKNLELAYPEWQGEITITMEANEAVPQADIIICSTKSTTPLFDGNLVKPGTHINAIGSYQPHMQEVDVQTLLRSDKVVVDTYEGAMHEAGDLLVPIKEGQWSSESIFAEIGEIICGHKNPRTDDSEITFYKSVGIGYLDTMVATSVYKKAIEKNCGQSISL